MGYRATFKICLLLAAYSALGETAPSSATKSVVFPKLLQERSEDGRRILEINDDLQLKLTKSSVFPEQFLYKEYEDDFEIQHHLEGRDLEKNLYHDSERMASLMVSTESGLEVEGILGKNLRIRPLYIEERNSQGDGGHLLYEVEERMPLQGDTLHAPGTELEEGASAFASPIYVDDRQDQTPKTETNPEVVVVVDTAHHRKFTGKGEEKRKKIIEYFGILVNAVNLKFSTLHYITAKLLLAGIWRHNETEESKYMDLHNENSLMNSYNSIRNLASYTNMKKEEFAPFDIVVLVTGRDLVRVYDDGQYSDGESGRAYVGMVCHEQYKVGIVEDFPLTYNGVHTFAHEVGHLMGCYHDGEDAPGSDPHHPGARNCSASERLIMSPYSSSANVDRFSYCCAHQVWVVYHRDTTACLKTRSDTTNYIVNKLPGDALKSADQYCKFEYPEHNATVRNEPNFAEGARLTDCIIVCQLSPDETKYYRFSSPDGIPCEANTTKVCVNKVCKEYIEF